MSDDLVDRLRTEQRLTDERLGAGRFQLTGEAADAIERLRAALEHPLIQACLAMNPHILMEYGDPR